MFVYPEINPVIVHIAGPLSIRWYGVAYLLGFLAAYYLGLKRIKVEKNMGETHFVDCIYVIMMGILLGGRVGYMLFYGWDIVCHEPIKILYLWEGGMSFHGGLIGGVLAIFFYARKYGYAFFTITDLIAPCIPIGLFFGRGANFINGELWGRVTDVPWAMVFPHVDANPRHPSQLYELFGEGVVLFILMQFFSRKSRKSGVVSGIFLLCYGVIRFILECFREPDIQLGYFWHYITMGQLLCVPMLAIGLWCIMRQKADVIGGHHAL